MNDVIHCINLSKRTDRMASIVKQSKDMKLPVQFWEGIVNPVMPFMGICQSFKRIVYYAKQNNLDRVIIMEDDCIFTKPNSYEYFLSQIPNEYDLMMGMVYEGNLNSENRIVSGFSGMTLFSVNKRFYDYFLQIRETNNIDRELGKFCDTKEYYVCDKFVAYQQNGYSDNKGRYAGYEHLLKGREMF